MKTAQQASIERAIYGRELEAPAAPVFKLYSGSIEWLRGGQVLAVRPCLCKRCGPFAIPRVYGRLVASVADPLTSQTHKLEHVRPESVGRES